LRFFFSVATIQRALSNNNVAHANNFDKIFVGNLLNYPLSFLDMRIFIFVTALLIFINSNSFARSNQKLLGICADVPHDKCIDCCKIITYLGTKSFAVQCPDNDSAKVTSPERVLEFLVESSINNFDIPGATYTIYRSMVDNLSCNDIRVFFQPTHRDEILISECLANCQPAGPLDATSTAETETNTTTTAEGSALSPPTE